MSKGQEQGCRHREQTFAHREEGQSRMHWESSSDICNLPCLKQMPIRKLLYSTGNSAWFSVMIQRCGMERRWKGGLRDRGYICIHRADSLFFFFFCTAETNITLQSNYQFSSVTQLCPTLCNPMNGSTLGLPVHHQLPESTQTHVH